MTITITINADSINQLDLSPAHQVIDKLLQSESTIFAQEQTLSFIIDYPRETEDPRELSEIPEIRLWFIRLDARYPWLPLILDWKTGELARYVAMLVPHQFHRTEGIQYNPEALEIFLMHKIFILIDWLNLKGIPSREKIKSMAKIIGYELDDGFFDLIH